MALREKLHCSALSDTSKLDAFPLLSLTVCGDLHFLSLFMSVLEETLSESILSYYTVFDCQGMSNRQAYPNSPRKYILRSSPLKGMERTVPSFKSFVRTAPPYSGFDDDKPLPPIPRSDEGPVSAQLSRLIPQLSNDTASDNSWKVPVEWEDPSTPSEKSQTSSGFTNQIYAPLIPEPSPGVLDMQAESAPWPLNLGALQQSRLQPIGETTSEIPSAPSPSPLRTLSSYPLSTVSVLSASEHVPKLKQTDTSSAVNIPNVKSETLNGEDMRAPSPCLSDYAFRISNLSTKQKAFASLGIENSSEQYGARYRSSSCPHSSHFRGAQPALLVNQIVNETNTNDRVQQLSVSRDYHNVLTGQYQEAQTSPTEELIHEYLALEGAKLPRATLLKPLSQDHGLIPPPLSWIKKNSNSYAPFPGSSTSSIRTDVKSLTKPKNKETKPTSWTPLQQLSNWSKRRRSSSGLVSRSIGDLADPSQNQISAHEIVPLLKKEIHISHLIPSIKGLRSSKTMKAANNLNSSTPQRRPSQPKKSTSSSQLKRKSPLLRLPGGLALVRQLPTTPQPPLRKSLDISDPLEIPNYTPVSDFPDFALYSPERRPSSLYSQQSQLPVAPGVAVERKPRASVSSLVSPKFNSNTLSPPTSPLAHKIPLLRTPPPRPSHPPRHPDSPRSKPPFLVRGHNKYHSEDECTDSTIEEDAHKRGIYLGIKDKARDARVAWKKHQREVKLEKLKQSITVLGPTDPAVVTRYVKREGRISEDRGAGGGRMPGYMVDGPL
jgi:hypothetical protein